MYYCENCNVQTEFKRCPRCGKRNLREIRDDDFCFFRQMEATSAENLKNKLDAENIGCALIPYGTGMRTRLGMHLESYLVFIEYRALDYVQDLFAQEALRKAEILKQEIVANIDKLHILPKDGLKIIKRLKLPKSTNLVELCKNVILTATSAVDTGDISEDEDDIAYNNGKPHGGVHYYGIANDQYELWLNSVSLRVYKVNKR